jgi:hypothetical protein
MDHKIESAIEKAVSKLIRKGYITEDLKTKTIDVINHYFVDIYSSDWTVDDIEAAADGLGIEIKKTEAQEILEEIYSEFDGSNGITWETVDDKLKEYRFIYFTPSFIFEGITYQIPGVTWALWNKTQFPVKLLDGRFIKVIWNSFINSYPTDLEFVQIQPLKDEDNWNYYTAYTKEN